MSTALVCLRDCGNGASLGRATRAAVLNEATGILPPELGCGVETTVPKKHQEGVVSSPQLAFALELSRRRRGEGTVIIDSGPPRVEPTLQGALSFLFYPAGETMATGLSLPLRVGRGGSVDEAGLVYWVVCTLCSSRGWEHCGRLTPAYGSQLKSLVAPLSLQ